MTIRLGFLTHVQGRGDLAQAYRDAQELFVVADELGFDVGWVAQHHLPIHGGGLSSPWTFLAHAAARTRRIRLATAITILPLEHPVRLAEDVAVVDALSGGRVEIGVGSGSGPQEYAAFGADFERRRELTTEHFAVLRRALAGEEVGTPGFTIQPPIAGDFTDRVWQGVFSATGARYAAEAGANLLLNRATYGYDEPTDQIQRGWADAYLQAWDGPHQPRIGLSRFVFPARDKREALTQIEEGVLRATANFVSRGTFPSGQTLEEYLRRFHAFYGHPDEIVAAFQQERVLPLATDLITQFNPGIPELGAAIRALELIATEVAPALGWKPQPSAD
ncbi:LLM class flavin-dependent oxidoreductase [Actinoplanes regularis]|uniref:Flavin-dependent oxidoreductase, luciferase family (Includes alkanesulfonate monooxygenase SsuD and methylene tetrahydromethanopterin reductase) n=1 Tax=Actinoplanes regularis TaxID=52697 RepID=A0A239AIH2_9ACTN|nr:LLM class flavin-dependent oxidoreductase [Actinoplanes regularis]GIE91840.1 luciferase [Actinoplanes regularis]SNR95457.1 Flavin-dependent oxidoreductase, luciferase family (includes alkanesulfonate monooxygenase SsuD and methylene tetrahydromethanopterin reductase) [Actinoplanes regularis]